MITIMVNDAMRLCISFVIFAVGLTSCALNDSGSRLPPVAEAGSRLAPRELSFLAACMMANVDTNWMFDQNVPDPLTYRGKAIGLFLGGAQTLRYDVHWFQCMGDLAGTNVRAPLRSDLALPYGGYKKALAELADLPLYQARQGSQEHSRDVNYYNPDIIRWAAQNLVPVPTDSVYGVVRYQDIYDRVLRRSARILAKTYVYLQKDGRLEKLTQEYAGKQSYDRLAMRERFADIHQDEYTNDDYDLNFDGGHAATFWFRRRMGGTDDEVWALVSKAMLMYDKTYFEGL